VTNNDNSDDEDSSAVTSSKLTFKFSHRKIEDMVYFDSCYDEIKEGRSDAFQYFFLKVCNFF
jgi:hypothetical protein